MRVSVTWPTWWVGAWIAVDRKTVLITRAGPEFAVTVSPAPTGPAYLSGRLLDGGVKRIERLPARCGIDSEGFRYLEIEAGTPDLGPTYRLQAVVGNGAGWTLAHADVPARRIALVPLVSIGLYDDYQDDLGVPWAYPLQPLTWRSP